MLPSKHCFPFFFRQMLFCRVTLGKSFLQFSTMKMAHAPPGHHSVIGRPSVNGLAYAEYVIYRGEQVWYPSSQPKQAPEHVRAESKEQLPFKEFSLWAYSPRAGLMS